MSLGYAEKLSYYEDLGGQFGAPELFETPEDLDVKSDQLAKLIKDAKRVVVFTGAGISTASGIPDFRGPQGIWTLQRAGLPLPKAKTSFALARPSLTHLSLLHLVNTGKVTYLVSQNVDGLHLRSGVSREKLAELHGNCFVEKCAKCGGETVRDFEMESVGFKYTGRRCMKKVEQQQGNNNNKQKRKNKKRNKKKSKKRKKKNEEEDDAVINLVSDEEEEEGVSELELGVCNGRLRDTVLDWEDALPSHELKLAQQHADEADLAICLGTSLQVTPACDLPLRSIKNGGGGKLVICNLQQTKHDKKADLVIHSKCDAVMSRVMSRLGMKVPIYERAEREGEEEEERLERGVSLF